MNFVSMAFAVSSRFKRYTAPLRKSEISQKHAMEIITFSFILQLEKNISPSFLSVFPIYLGSAEGKGGNVIYMAIVFRSSFIPFYKWIFKIEGEKCIFFLWW